MSNQNTKWEVQTNFFGTGWTNTWRTEDNKPEYFSTKKDAQKELSSFLKEAEEEFGKGEYARSEFRIVKI